MYLKMEHLLSSKCSIFHNIFRMKIEHLLLSKWSIFHNIFRRIQNFANIFLEFFSMLSKNRKWCHDLKIAFGVKGLVRFHKYGISTKISVYGLNEYTSYLQGLINWKTDENLYD